MDNILKALKWFLVNWKLILPILAFLGITGGYAVYAPEKPPQVTKPLPIPPEPVKEKPPVQPPIIVREVIREVPNKSCNCGELIHQHEREYHFTE